MNSDLGLTPDDKEFHLQVAIALSDCQYVEFLLKHYELRGRYAEYSKVAP